MPRDREEAGTTSTTTSTTKATGKRPATSSRFSGCNQTLDPKTLEDGALHRRSGAIRSSARRADCRELGKLADIGVDGCLISWVRYKEELAQWNEEVLPLMVQAGLRQPFPPAEQSRAAPAPTRAGSAAVA
jgi:hypothetical protein